MDFIEEFDDIIAQSPDAPLDIARLQEQALIRIIGHGLNAYLTRHAAPNDNEENYG